MREAEFFSVSPCGAREDVPSVHIHYSQRLTHGENDVISPQKRG